MITFTALGTPIPKGSTRAFTPKGWTRPIITSDNPQAKSWAQQVLDAAVGAMGTRPPIDGPVSLRLKFYLARPKSTPRRVIHQTRKPDLDKLVRCVKDAMTRAGVYHDDAQVIALTATKEFAGGAFDPLRERGVPRVDVAVAPYEAAQVPLSSAVGA